MFLQGVGVGLFNREERQAYRSKRNSELQELSHKLQALQYCLDIYSGRPTNAGMWMSVSKFMENKFQSSSEI